MFYGPFSCEVLLFDIFRSTLVNGNLCLDFTVIKLFTTRIKKTRNHNEVIENVSNGALLHCNKTLLFLISRRFPVVLTRIANVLFCEKSS